MIVVCVCGCGCGCGCRSGIYLGIYCLLTNKLDDLISIITCTHPFRNDEIMSIYLSYHLVNRLFLCLFTYLFRAKLVNKFWQKIQIIHFTNILSSLILSLKFNTMSIKFWRKNTNQMTLCNDDVTKGRPYCEPICHFNLVSHKKKAPYG